MENAGSTSQPFPDGQAPRLSVIVPARNAAEFLGESLAALRASEFPPDGWELIVVDDASHDGTAAVAASYADLVVRLDVAQGPAAARNRAAREAGGEVLVFIDADVSVHPDALHRFHQTFVHHADVGAVFGAYDTAPRAPGLVSQYRNLLHHWVHAEGAGEAETFWAGCGAVRLAAFSRAGGFDATLRQLEDIDLGYRIRALGYRILLRPDIQGTHLKRWTLGSMVVTDLLGRGVTWTRFYLERRSHHRVDTLNIRAAEKVHTLLAGFALGSLTAAGLWHEPAWLMVTLACVATVVLANVPLLRWFARERGIGFALGVVPLRLLYYALNAAAVALGLLSYVVAARPRRPLHPSSAPTRDQASS